MNYLYAGKCWSPFLKQVMPIPTNAPNRVAVVGIAAAGSFTELVSVKTCETWDQSEARSSDCNLARRLCTAASSDRVSPSALRAYAPNLNAESCARFLGAPSRRIVAFSSLSGWSQHRLVFANYWRAHTEQYTSCCRLSRHAVPAIGCCAMVPRSPDTAAGVVLLSVPQQHLPPLHTFATPTHKLVHFSRDSAVVLATADVHRSARAWHFIFKRCPTPAIPQHW